jgi:acyl carrier protein
MQMSENKLKQILADVFSEDIENINEEASADTIEKWDSLNHLNLVLAIESEFDISLSEDDSIQIMNYPLIKEILKDYDIHFA